jgi:transposase
MTYSVRLRQQIVAALDTGMSQVEASGAFGVSVATIQRYLRQRRLTGELDPRSIPGRPPFIGPADLPALAVQLAAHPHATISDHCRLWEQATGKRPYRVTMGRAIRELGWTRRWSR